MLSMVAEERRRGETKRRYAGVTGGAGVYGGINRESGKGLPSDPLNGFCAPILDLEKNVPAEWLPGPPKISSLIGV